MTGPKVPKAEAGARFGAVVHHYDRLIPSLEDRHLMGPYEWVTESWYREHERRSSVRRVFAYRGGRVVEIT